MKDSEHDPELPETERQVGRFERRLGTLLTITVFLIGPIAFLSPKGLLSVVLPVSVACVIGIQACRGSLDPVAILRRGWPLWIIAAVALVSTLWSITPADSLLRGLRLILEFAAGLALLGYFRNIRPREARHLILTVGYGLIAAFLFVLADIATSGGLSSKLGLLRGDPRYLDDFRQFYSRGSVLTGILLLPLVVTIYRLDRARLAIILGVAGALTVMSLATVNAKFALSGALVILGVTLIWRNFCWVIMSAALLVLMASPLVFPLPLESPIVCLVKDIKHTAVQRLMINNYIDELIAQRPILGWGLDSSRALSSQSTNIAMPSCGAPPSNVTRADALPLHPHNAPMQLRVELGWPGVIVGSILLITIFRPLLKRVTDRLLGAALWAAFCAWFLQSLGGFGIWQGWLLAAEFIIASLLAAAMACQSGNIGRPVRDSVKEKREIRH